MIRRRKFTPYVRRCRPTDKSEGYRVAVQMAVYGTGCYVMVQRGFPKLAIAAARTKDELIGRIIGVRIETRRRRGECSRPASVDFRRWANRLGRQARGAGRPGVEK